MLISILSEPISRQATFKVEVECCSKEYWRLLRFLNHLQHLEDDELPTVTIGDVHPLPAADLGDKEFPKKVLEEAAEVYSAWEDVKRSQDERDENVKLRLLMYECADVIQTAVNMYYAAQKRLCEVNGDRVPTGDYDMRPLLRAVFMSNKARGRYDTAEED